MKLSVNNKFLILLIYFTIFIAIDARSQQFFISDTVRGKLGSEIDLPVYFAGEPPLKVIEFEGRFQLSNPTVFFPKRFIISENCIFHRYTFERINDSVYHFNFMLEPLNGNLINKPAIFLVGEMLAGSDTMTAVKFLPVSVDEIQIDEFTGIIISQSDFIPRRYSRFAYLSEGSPNPIAQGNPIKWTFEMDKPSDVKVYFVDYLGKKYLEKDYGFIDRGIYDFVFTPDGNISSGAYWIVVQTNSGTVSKKFIIIK